MRFTEVQLERAVVERFSVRTDDGDRHVSCEPYPPTSGVPIVNPCEMPEERVSAFVAAFCPDG